MMRRGRRKGVVYEQGKMGAAQMMGVALAVTTLGCLIQQPLK